VDPSPIIVLKGGDEVLLSNALTDLIHELVGSEDRALLVEELTIEAHVAPDDDGYDIGRLVDSAQTPPFLTDRRIIVSRNSGVFSTKDAVAPLVAYLTDPLETNTVVLVWEKDPRPQRQPKLPGVPKSLTDAVAACGGAVIDTSGGSGKAQEGWVAEQLRSSALKFDASAQKAISDHVGDEINRLPGILTTLEGVFASGTRVAAGDVEPFLGVAGDIAPWDLTDAIDNGDVSGALDALQRMLVGGARHPLQVLATLNTHYLRMVQLDSPDIRGEKMASEVLGLKAGSYPARKALAGAHKLGSDRLQEFVALLAQADLDLHGARNWPPELVVEVLVARLAGRSRSARSGRR
jgi:DNA polymerase-3 subunit delta